MSGLVLLLFLVGCTAKPALTGPRWYAQASPGHHIVDVDVEAPTPQRAQELRHNGVQLPRLSQGLADPRAHRDFVELRVTAVGFGIAAGGYLLYCEGLPLPVIVPESHVDLGLTSAEAPEPAAAPAAPAPASGSPAPSPGLVQTLTGNNPTPPMAAGPRLPQDVAVSPKVPGVRQLNRPIGSSPSHNTQAQADIQYLRDIGATNIRVNQQQITVRNGQRVGTNRPDLQFDYNGRRYHVEYDTPTSGRGPGHQSRITSNDPGAESILLIAP